MDINILKVVKNSCYGGFSLSEEAHNYLDKKYENLPWGEYEYGFENHRDNPKLIDVVETLGTKAFGQCSNLVIVEVPDDVEWFIDEYDGWETIREKHRTW